MDRSIKPVTHEFVVSQIEELWHNIYRMHGYLEVELAGLGSERPGVLQNADSLLRASYARVSSVLNDDHLRHLEKPPPG
jgi:hypothetical protein